LPRIFYPSVLSSTMTSTVSPPVARTRS
jgi:hypothetical protein